MAGKSVTSRLRCLAFGHNYDPQETVAGGYRMGLLDRRHHDHEHGTILVQSCSDCGSFRLRYDPEREYRCSV